jgi:hypothetical protein
MFSGDAGTVPKRESDARTPGSWKTRSCASRWKRAQRPEVVVEGLREDERIRDQCAAGVVADKQDRPLRGNVVEAPDLGAVVDVRDMRRVGSVVRTYEGSQASSQSSAYRRSGRAG